MVHQNDGSIVLDVPDDSAYRLIDSPRGLLAVPLAASEAHFAHLILLLQILFLQDHDRVRHLRVRNADE